MTSRIGPWRAWMRADRILLIVQQDVSSLKSAQLTLRVFSDLDYDDSKIGIVVNRHLKNNEIELQDIENHIEASGHGRHRQ